MRDAFGLPLKQVDKEKKIRHCLVLKIAFVVARPLPLVRQLKFLTFSSRNRLYRNEMSGGSQQQQQHNLEDLLASLATISDLQSRGVLRDVQPGDREAYLARLTAQADQIKALMAALQQPTNGNGNHVVQDANANNNAHGQDDEEEELYVNLGPAARIGSGQGRRKRRRIPFRRGVISRRIIPKLLRNFIALFGA